MMSLLVRGGRIGVDALGSCFLLFCIGMLCVACVGLARRLLRQSTALALPLAFCILVAIETILFNLLSMFRGVTRGAVLFAHVVILVALGIAFFYGVGRRKGAPRDGALAPSLTKQLLACLQLFGRTLRCAASAAARSPITGIMFPLVLVLVVEVLIFAPNNYDSMTYHLARVVHWIQNQSVGFFSTSNPRENDTGPGAEYVLLLLQILSKSDRFAGLVQTSSFVIIVVFVNAFARLLRAPRSLRIPLVLILATTPIFVLQATTTQNDLCAAVTSLGLVAALRKPLWGRPWTAKPRDGLALGIALGAAYLVKPTALLFVAPLLAVALVRVAVSMVRQRKQALRAILISTSLALLTCTALCAPHAARKLVYGGFVGATESEVIFPLTQGWLGARRIVNPLLALSHHIPSPPLHRALAEVYASAKKVDPPRPARGGIDAYYAGHVFRQYEDLAGAPIQFGAIVLFTVCGFLFVCLSRSRRAVHWIFTLTPLLGWVVFHWVARNNQWIARYHAPWFALAIISAFGVCQLARHRFARAVLVLAAWAGAGLSVAYAWSTVVANELKPLSSTALERHDRAQSYYVHDPNLMATHTGILKVAAERSCTSLVLWLGNDDVMEYQLSWRAWQQGIRVHHSPGPADACLMYAPNGLAGWPAAKETWKPISSWLPMLFTRG